MLEIVDSPQDGAYGAGVWLQIGAKFGLVALMGVLRFLVYRGGKHVLGTFVRKTITTILANYCYLLDICITFLKSHLRTTLNLFYLNNLDTYCKHSAKRQTY